MPNPRATGSNIFTESKIAAPKFAPINPETTTILTAKETSAPDNPSMEAMAIANGDVMFLDSNERRIEGLRIWTSRTINAVPNNPPTDEPTTAVLTSAMFCFISVLRLYIWQARATTAGPSMNRRTSPAPVPAKGNSDPTLYERSISLNPVLVSSPKTLAKIQVKLVQVTSGCMILVMLAGTRVAPNTNVDRVVKSKNADLAGAVIHESDDVRLASVASAPHVMALKERAFKVDAEKAGFGLETADVEESLFNDCK
mmetsp:Transcript_61296/g.71668  ORF Transcript_61296/g.71668 Transcript_61296/m.71668 type:complete len:256 (+) Transcript_61296:124-891(+)